MTNAQNRNAAAKLMPRSMRRGLKKILGRFLQIREPFERADFTPEEREIIARVSGYTMTTPERLISLLRSIDYLSENNIQGAIVECGVYKGGSVMAACMQLLNCSDTERSIYLYDTFEGMVRPDDVDVDLAGRPALDDFLEHSDESGEKSSWAREGLENVRKAVFSTGYPKGNFHFVQGMVEETIPQTLPDSIALLRLDTDWYASTKHELEHLYPRLCPGGVLIIDDYGHYEGARKAVDEYLAQLDYPMLLNRIDYSGRIVTKPLSL